MNKLTFAIITATSAFSAGLLLPTQTEAAHHYPGPNGSCLSWHKHCAVHDTSGKCAYLRSHCAKWKTYPPAIRREGRT